MLSTKNQSLLDWRNTLLLLDAFLDTGNLFVVAMSVKGRENNICLRGRRRRRKGEVYLIIGLDIELYLFPSQSTHSITRGSASSTSTTQLQDLLDQHLYDRGAVVTIAAAAAAVGSAVEVQERKIVEQFRGSYHGGLDLQFLRWCGKEGRLDDENKPLDTGGAEVGLTHGSD